MPHAPGCWRMILSGTAREQRWRAGSISCRSVCLGRQPESTRLTLKVLATKLSLYPGSHAQHGVSQDGCKVQALTTRSVPRQRIDIAKVIVFPVVRPGLDAADLREERADLVGALRHNGDYHGRIVQNRDH